MGTVLVARALAVVPVVTALDRFAVIPRVGLRNEAVLVWGGLRGAVALALALALPTALPERDMLIAMTGGVVLATLLLNATTISRLVHWLGLDEPSRTERFLLTGARLSAIEAARDRLGVLDMDDATVEAELEQAATRALEELQRVELSDREERLVVVQRGLAVERRTYQHLSDSGLLPPAVARTLLDEVDDQIEVASMRQRVEDGMRRGRRRHVSRPIRWLVSHLPQPAGEDPRRLAYAETSARRLAADRALEALRLMERLPNVSHTSVREAMDVFTRWEHGADDALAALDEVDGHHALRRIQSVALIRATSRDALTELAHVGVLPPAIARAAAFEIGEPARDPSDNRD